MLPFCEFSINSSQQASTGNSLFYLNYGSHPRAPADFVAGNLAQNDTTDWLQARSDAIKIAKDAILDAQARQALYADQTRASVAYEVGDKVMGFHDFLQTPEARNRPSCKLRPRWFGPFVITARVGANAYRLQLPHTLRCHPVFNVAALRLYQENTIPGRQQPRPMPIVDADGFTRYIVEQVLNHRVRRGRTQYLVKWKGYADATWEPAHFLVDESGKDIVQLQQ